LSAARNSVPGAGPAHPRHEAAGPAARCGSRGPLIRKSLNSWRHVVVRAEPVFTEDRPELLVVKFAGATERPIQRRLRLRPTFPEHAIAAAVLDARAGFEPVNAGDLEDDFQGLLRG